MIESNPWGWDPAWGPAPRWSTRRNPDRKTYGGVVAKVAAMLGKPLFRWQRWVCDIALEVDADGGFIYDTVEVLAPRRAGKTAMMQAVACHRCSGPRRTTSWVTAQDGLRALARWREASDDIVRVLGWPFVKRLISIGHEGVFWPATGSFFKPFAPAEEAMHGESPDLVFIDELWAFSAEEQKAIQQGYRPSWLVKTGQEWLLSAAGKPNSEWLKAARLAGRAAAERGQQHGTAHFEWCIPEEVDGVPSRELPDEELIKVAAHNHPRLLEPGFKIGYLASELEKRGRVPFLRDYGGLDEDTDTAVGLIPAEVLRQAASGDRIPADARVGIGVQVDDDQREASISAGWRDEDGRCLTALIRTDGGTGWVLDVMLAIRERNDIGVVAIGNTGPNRDVADQLERAGFTLLRVSVPDRQAADNRLYAELLGRTVRHGMEPELFAAVKSAGWRRAGSGRVFTSLTGKPITAVDAHAYAVWAADHLPEIERVAYSWAAY